MDNLDKAARSLLSYREKSRLFQLSQDSPAWKLDRNQFVTSSVLPELCGVGYQTWKNFSNGVNPCPDWILEWGKTHESDAAIAFSDHFTYMVTPGLFVWEQDNRFACSIDRIVLSMDKDKKKYTTEILEIKCPLPRGGSIELPNHISDIKPRVLVQVFFQMMIANVDSALIGYWSPTGNRLFRIYRCKQWEKWFDGNREKFIYWNSNRKNFVRHPFREEGRKWKQNLTSILVDAVKHAYLVDSEDVPLVLLPLSEGSGDNQRQEKAQGIPDKGGKSGTETHQSSSSEDNRGTNEM